MHLLACERLEVLLDLGELLFTARHFHTPKRGLEDSQEEPVHFLLLLSGWVPDGTLAGCVAYIDLVWLVLIRHNDVYEHVDNKGSILSFAVLSHLDIRIDGCGHRKIVGYNLSNFG